MRSKRQLNAISRSYSEKRKREAYIRAHELGVDELFPFQPNYKTVRGFVDAYGTSNFKAAVISALHNLDERKRSLEGSHAPHEYIECTDTLIKRCYHIIKEITDND